MNLPSDQSARDRFIGELDSNFSVVASAGSGKTRAITDRIVAMAQHADAADWLPRLVVVTFTNRAADEMQQRARQQVLAAGVSLNALTAFNRAFFGTIHSFCMKLLRQHGHHIGLPGRLELLSDDTELWNEFVQRQTVVGESLTQTQRSLLLRLVPVAQLMELGRKGGAVGAEEFDPGECPELDVSEITAFNAKKQSLATVTRSREALDEWMRRLKEPETFVGPLPQCESTPLRPAWNAALEPIRDWIRCCSLKVAAEIERAYREFRLSKGVLTYDDQVGCARELLAHPEAARRIREKDYRVILDEAQDTDPEQFTMLLELTRPPHAAGSWLQSKTHPPRPGRFCMVGDFQQSIFGDRADLDHYRRVHDQLLSSGAGESLVFSVTFRLDQRQIEFVNETFEHILNELDGQVRFVRLNARPLALPGQIIRFDLAPDDSLAELSESERALHEARTLAAWLTEHGLEKLRARSLRDVAILCPRKDWFRPLRLALRSAGLAVQVQSERDLRGDSAAYAWLTALLTVMAEPKHSYEIVGVLREIFGLSDHDLAAFANGESSRFHLTNKRWESGAVGETLRLLADICAAVAPLPLASAVREIIARTELRERLNVLPGEEFEGASTEIDDLLTLAAVAEAEGKSLATFAERLRDGFHEIREVRATERDAIQLITSQKAKGSEWQAVVVPFLARPIRPPSPRYPRLVPSPSGPLVALGGDYIDDATKEALAARRRQETERLLYVALTRAKHTLVIAHDHFLFSGKSGVAQTAQAHLLRCHDEGENAAAFQRLEITPASCDATSERQLADAERRSEEQRVVPLAEFRSGDAATSRERATHFVKRNPSALAESAVDPNEAAPRPMLPEAADAGALHGTWWHEFVEQLDWHADEAAWSEPFERAVLIAPNAERARSEWNAFLRCLGERDEIVAQLTASDAIVKAEMPFLWAMNEGECLEGIIDLAIFDPARGECLLLDWKTNRIDAAEADDLRKKYQPQLAAYWRAIGATTGLKVRAALYSTTLGKWLRYDEQSLAETWEIIASDRTALMQAMSLDPRI